MKRISLIFGSALLAAAVGCSGGSDPVAPETPSGDEAAAPADTSAVVPVSVVFHVPGMI
jgi:hypothetical protein